MNDMNHMYIPHDEIVGWAEVHTGEGQFQNVGQVLRRSDGHTELCLACYPHSVPLEMCFDSDQGEGSRQLFQVVDTETETRYVSIGKVHLEGLRARATFNVTPSGDPSLVFRS